MTDFMSKSVGVSFTTRRWGNKRKAQHGDTGLNAVVTDTGASSTAVELKKHLIPPHHLAECNNIVGRFYRYHYRMTLPWLDKMRVIPTDMFFNEYRHEFNKTKQEFEAWKKKFISIYPTIVTNESDKFLGTMFKASDYPTAAELEHKFDIDIVVMPVPTAADFRIECMEEQLSELEQSWQEKLDAQACEATSHLYESMKEPLLAVTELTNKKIIHERVINNVYDTASTIRKLNIFGEDRLNEILTLIESKKISVETLRSSPEEEKPKVVSWANTMIKCLDERSTDPAAAPKQDDAPAALAQPINPLAIAPELAPRQVDW